MKTFAVVKDLDGNEIRVHKACEPYAEHFFRPKPITQEVEHARYDTTFDDPG